MTSQCDSSRVREIEKLNGKVRVLRVGREDFLVIELLKVTSIGSDR